jgi:uncharacterized membrane protein YphA (DoxX/SURF4 family)
MNNNFLISLAITLVFIAAGYTKVTGFDKSTKYLQENLNASYQLCQLGILLAIFIELIGSIVILYSAATGTNNKYAKLFIKALMALTVAIAIIFHKDDIPGFLKCITIIGALYLLDQKF